MTAPAPQLAPVDVGVTLGELDGHPVVIAACATAGITTQIQLPPAQAAQYATAILAAAAHAGADLADVLTQLGAAAGGLELPDLSEIIRLGGG